jgi:hypothetical protein
MHKLDQALFYSINGEPDKGEEILRSLPQDDIRVIFNLGWHEMRHGNMKSAFDNFNYGRFINVFGLPPIYGKIWKDEPLKGKTLLFRCEGGFGDQICNFRFAKKFEQMGARVIISCSDELKELFSENGFICVSNDGIQFLHYDYWIPAMSSSYILDMEYNDLDGSPYIIPPYIRNISNSKKLKVGIRWSGNPEFEDEQNRRFDKELMINLHDIEGTEFFSLQRDENLVENLPFKDMRDKMKTWSDTASIIAGCDLIISSCTSIAHLSAAMGIPTWIVVPILPYYTWAVPGNTSKWYDSVKLYRQEKYNDWDSIFKKVREDLKLFSVEFNKD